MTVVFAILLALAALLLPAIQRSRERARVAQCRNNVAQIGLALQNYLLAHRVLPSGCVNSTGPIQSVEDTNQYHMSWIAQILPNLEEANTFHHIDFNNSAYAVENQLVRSHVVEILNCPSMQWPFASTIARSCYSGVHNDFETPIDVNQNGVLFLNSSVSLEEVKDGCSSTAFVMESTPVTTVDLGWMSGTHATLRNGVSSSEEPGTMPQFRLRTNVNATVPQGSSLPNLVGGPGSFHESGFHAGFGDGSVRFVRLDVDPKLLRNLCHRADGEMLNEF
ncbi:MAG: DUF1559 domain-containing protein [Planctomycetes bacterium]|nr:DUF1559 domain-containing protein [Planctomycetota bacterium]